MESTPHLAALELRELADALAAMAKRARAHAEDQDVVQLHGMLEEVRAAADVATKERRALLDTAESFLRALARTDLGKREVALRKFFVEHADEAEPFLTKLLRPQPVGERDFGRMPEAARVAALSLADCGVIRRGQRETYYLVPALRPVAKDLVEPVAFRLWRRVERCRASISFAGMNDFTASAYLATQCGVTAQQAGRFLTNNPVQPGSAAEPSSHGLGGRETVTVLYRDEQVRVEVPSDADRPDDSPTLPLAEPDEVAAQAKLKERVAWGSQSDVGRASWN